MASFFVYFLEIRAFLTVSQILFIMISSPYYILFIKIGENMNLGGIDPRRMQSMMKQMGIENTEIPAKRVIIETDSKKIIIENPNVTQVSMQGQKTFQIMGDIKEENEIPKEDIEMVVTATGKSEAEAKAALEKENGDIAKAIESLQ
jgi:nascent polypeptide-associated complex subunit alpha